MTTAIHVLVERYSDADLMRQKELDICLDKNLANTEIEAVWAFGLPADIASSPIHPKLHTVSARERMTFSDFFDFASERLSGRICVVANADIYFDETIAYAKRLNLGNYSLTLTRWDVLDNGAATFFGRADSADSWFFLSPIRIPQANFVLGVPGCDNRVARLLRDHGRAVINPSLTIKSFHLHRSKHRNYTARDRVPGPYLYVRPYKVIEST